MMILLLFVVFNFFIGFVSDLTLNWLSYQSWSPKAILALRTYFGKRILVPAVLAGLTIVVGLAATIGINQLLFGFLVPIYMQQLLRFSTVAFVVGYIMDVLIRDLHVFGTSLDAFYDAAGAGFGGAFSLLFTIFGAYFLMHKYKWF